MTNQPPLTLLEEFILLALDEKTGQLRPLNPFIFNRAVAGAVLMDLTLRNRIDNDLRDMFTVDPTPTGDDILDPVLQILSTAPVLTPHPISFWLRRIADEAEIILGKVLRRLEKRGTLRTQPAGLFWMFGTKQTSALDEQDVRETKARLLGVIYGSDIPTPRGIMLTGLADACGLFGAFLNETESRDTRARIMEVTRMDLIGQAITAKENADAEPSALATANQ